MLVDGGLDGDGDGGGGGGNGGCDGLGGGNGGDGLGGGDGGDGLGGGDGGSGLGGGDGGDGLGGGDGGSGLGGGDGGDGLGGGDGGDGLGGGDGGSGLGGGDGGDGLGGGGGGAQMLYEIDTMAMPPVVGTKPTMSPELGTMATYGHVKPAWKPYAAKRVWLHLASADVPHDTPTPPPPRPPLVTLGAWVHMTEKDVERYGKERGVLKQAVIEFVVAAHHKSHRYGDVQMHQWVGKQKWVGKHSANV